MAYRSTDGGTRNWSDSDGGELSDSDDESISNYQGDYDYEEPEDDSTAAGEGYSNEDDRQSEFEEEEVGLPCFPELSTSLRLTFVF